MCGPAEGDAVNGACFLAANPVRHKLVRVGGAARGIYQASKRFSSSILSYQHTLTNDPSTQAPNQFTSTTTHNNTANMFGWGTSYLTVIAIPEVHHLLTVSNRRSSRGLQEVQ